MNLNTYVCVIIVIITKSVTLIKHCTIHNFLKEMLQKPGLFHTFLIWVTCIGTLKDRSKSAIFFSSKKHEFRKTLEFVLQAKYNITLWNSSTKKNMGRTSEKELKMENNQQGRHWLINWANHTKIDWSMLNSLNTKISWRTTTSLTYKIYFLLSIIFQNSSLSL